MSLKPTESGGRNCCLSNGCRLTDNLYIYRNAWQYFWLRTVEWEGGQRWQGSYGHLAQSDLVDVPEYVANSSMCGRGALFGDMDNYTPLKVDVKCLRCNVCCKSCQCSACESNLNRFALILLRLISPSLWKTFLFHPVVIVETDSNDTDF